MMKMINSIGPTVKRFIVSINIIIFSENTLLVIDLEQILFFNDFESVNVHQGIIIRYKYSKNSNIITS